MLGVRRVILNHSYYRHSLDQFVRVKRCKSMSSHQLKQQLKQQLTQLKSEKIVVRQECQEMLSRTRVISDVSESRAVVDKILETGAPVGVDMEGVVNEVTGMIQVRH